MRRTYTCLWDESVPRGGQTRERSIARAAGRCTVEVFGALMTPGAPYVYVVGFCRVCCVWVAFREEKRGDAPGVANIRLVCPRPRPRERETTHITLLLCLPLCFGCEPHYPPADEFYAKEKARIRREAKLKADAAATAKAFKAAKA